MKMKIIYDESVNIENQNNDKVLINMSYEEYCELRTTLLMGKRRSCLEWYNRLVEARAKAKTQWE